MIGVNKSASREAAKLLRPPQFWIAKPLKQAKKGAVRHYRLRRQQENQGQAATSAGRYARVSARRFGTSGQCSGPRRRERSVVLQLGDIPALVFGVGRRSLRRRTRELDSLPLWTAFHCGWTLEIVKKSEEQKDLKGFAVQPHRWVVERTFAWLCKYRRLVKDYEFLTESSEAMIRLAMCHVLVRRLKTA